MLRKIFIRNCKRIEPLLWQYAGGQIKTGQKAYIEAHLAHCAACQAQLQAIARIGQGLETLRQAPVPATQTNWAEVQARLAAMPVLPQPVVPMRKATPYRILIGAGSVAAMALLWVALVPRGGEQETVTAEMDQNRPSKQNLPALTVTTDNDTNPNANTNRVAFKKSFLRKNSQAGSPYLPRTFAPPTRLSKFSLAADTKFTPDTAVTWRGGKSARRRHFARRHGLLLARTEIARLQQNALAPLSEGATPMVVTLAVETPNYVLTGVEAEAEPRRPRAYVMDCLSTDAKSQNNEVSSRNGEERAW